MSPRSPSVVDELGNEEFLGVAPDFTRGSGLGDHAGDLQQRTQCSRAHGGVVLESVARIVVLHGVVGDAR